MSDFLEAMHAAMFEQLFGLDAESRAQMAEYMREMHFSEAEIAAQTSPGIHEGVTFGDCLMADVARLVERVLLRQGAESVVVQVRRRPHDACGRVDVKIVQIVPGALAG